MRYHLAAAFHFQLRVRVNAVSFGYLRSPLLLFLSEVLLMFLKLLFFICVGGEFLGEVEQSRLLAERYGCEREVVLADGSRVDLLSARYAVEVEWCEKWKEAPAQAVLYSAWTGRKPAVILLVGKGDAASEKVSILRCKLVCERMGVSFATVKAVER